MRNLIVGIFGVALSGCVSERRADALVPGIGEAAVTKVDGVLWNCDFVTNTSDAWFKGHSDAICLGPTDLPKYLGDPIAKIGAGTTLTNLRAVHVNGFDSATCLLKASISHDERTIYIWDIHVEALIGLGPKASWSWACRSTKTLKRPSVD